MMMMMCDLRITISLKTDRNPILPKIRAVALVNITVATGAPAVANIPLLPASTLAPKIELETNITAAETKTGVRIGTPRPNTSLHLLTVQSPLLLRIRIGRVRIRTTTARREAGRIAAKGIGRKSLKNKCI